MTTIVITGANTGIGRATAEGLAAPGTKLILAGRSLERTQEVIDAAKARGAEVEFVELDLANLASTRKAAAEIMAKAPQIDVLINNAGVGGVRGNTSDGFEMNVGINHLGHFALTMGLIEGLKASKTRVVCVASEMHRRSETLDFAAFEGPTKSVTGIDEYCDSKLCNVLFASELARRYGEHGITAVSVHPGFIASDIWRHIPAPVRWGMKLFMSMSSTEDGARTSVHCATAPLEAGLNGAYFDASKPREPARVAQDQALAKELWERSAKLVSR